MCKYQLHFFCTFAYPAHLAADRFPRSRLRGKQGTRVYTTAQVSVPAEHRGARSGRSKSHAIGQAFTGSLCGSTSRAEQWKTQNIILLPCSLPLLLYYVSHRPSSSQALYLVAAKVHQAIHLITATDGASVCACLYLVSGQPTVANTR